MKNSRNPFKRIPPLRELTMRRFAKGVRKYAGFALNDSLVYCTSRLQPEFQRQIIRGHFSAEPAELDRLLGFEEMKSSAWLGLAKLGYRIVQTFRPQVVVELGTHVGLSALAMGVGLRELGQGGKVYAVDTWEGDEHAGTYGQSVFETFLRRVDELGLGATVVPRRMLFDDAFDQVPRPIDLLHIDGLHTWDAVSHDWAKFGPLVRPGGIVMFHDVNSMWPDVARFWNSLRTRFPSHTIPQSSGLGILQVPAGGIAGG